ncbi:MAG TPA: tRNA pseudouridine(38-40) synthase TruA [Solirubrobacteraceae bacterium]|nr:tRNA pseudouridine(38-40) synthase TruA [Solirubrobacteraceae bacterium]
MTARLDLEYDGRDFAGWAAQPGRRTVEGELRRALTTVLREPPRDLRVAGRTDAGVHASGQVVSFAAAAPRSASLNALLPDDVTVLASAQAHAGFDARHDAIARRYAYRLLARRERPALDRGRVLWWRRRVDRDLLHACAALLPGEHDFTAFTPTETQHRHFSRTVLDARWVEDGEELRFEIEADAFLRHMNRVLVGTMLEVAAGRRPVAAFAALLEGAPRAAAGITAPAHALCLTAVRYPDPPTASVPGGLV